MVARYKNIGQPKSPRTRGGFATRRHRLLRWLGQSRCASCVFVRRADAIYSAPGSCSSIQRRTSSARQAVTRGESLTGVGKVPAPTRRQRVDLEMGTKRSTCGCRRNPVAGRVKLVESSVNMINPLTGICRMKKYDPLSHGHGRSGSHGR